VHEKKSFGPEDVATSAVVNPVSTASASNADAPTEKSSTLAASPTDVDEDSGVAPKDSSDGVTPAFYHNKILSN
jgi:hypothetical protein